MEEQTPQEIENRTTELLPVGTLAERAFSIYRENAARFIWIMAIPAGAAILSLFLEHVPFFGSLGAFGYLVSAALSVLALPAFLYAIEDPALSVSDAYREGFSLFFPYIWIALLGGLIIFGGIPFFIVTAIILGTWFTFAPYALFFENDRGLAVFTKSREYVRDRFWPVLWRIFAVYFPIFIAIAIVGAIFQAIFGVSTMSEEAGENFVYVFNNVAQVFIGPFFAVYGYLLYKNMRQIRPELIDKSVQKGKGLFTSLAVFGIFVFIVFMLLVVAFSEGETHEVPWGGEGITRTDMIR